MNVGAVALGKRDRDNDGIKSTKALQESGMSSVNQRSKGILCGSHTNSKQSLGLQEEQDRQERAVILCINHMAKD